MLCDINRIVKYNAGSFQPSEHNWYSFNRKKFFWMLEGKSTGEYLKMLLPLQAMPCLRRLVSRRSLTAKARVSPCEICGGQDDPVI
jgi:hypothetical protein